MLIKQGKSTRLGIAIILAASTALAFVSARNRASTLGRGESAPESWRQPPQQTAARAGSGLRGRLSLQPEALKLGRRLGKRFQGDKPIDSVAVGSLTLGAERQVVRVIRHQDGDGERLEIALGGGPATLSWSAATGAMSSNAAASGDLRTIVERLALDGPDQFVLAQLRGASYYTVARGARPSEASGADGYTGPTWDVVRVGEPRAGAAIAPQSGWRLYYINSAKGLLDRVVSEEQGEQVVAEITGWSNQGGEFAPSHIVWTRGGRTVMEYEQASFSYGAR